MKSFRVDENRRRLWTAAIICSSQGSCVLHNIASSYLACRGWRITLKAGNKNPSSPKPAALNRRLAKPNIFQQILNVSETESSNEKARRWGAFVCPDCRFLFRIPGDHDGLGIVCPSCRRMLRIPKDGDAVSPLIKPIKRIRG